MFACEIPLRRLRRTKLAIISDVQRVHDRDGQIGVSRSRSKIRKRQRLMTVRLLLPWLPGRAKVRRVKGIAESTL